MGHQSLAFIQNLGAWELIMIFLIVLLLFGAKRLPEISKSIGKSIKEFKRATSGVEEDIRTAMDTEDEPKGTAKVESKSAKSLSAEKSEDPGETKLKTKS